MAVFLFHNHTVIAKQQASVGLGIGYSYGGGTGIYIEYSHIFIGVGHQGQVPGWQIGLMYFDHKKSSFFALASYGVSAAIGQIGYDYDGFELEWEPLMGPVFGAGYHWKFMKNYSFRLGLEYTVVSYEDDYEQIDGLGLAPNIGFSIIF